MKLQLPAFAGSFSDRRKWPALVDFAIFGTVIAGFYGVVQLARYWASAAVPSVDISHSAWALPGYAFYSVVRLFSAYALSLVFAVGYGYAAAYSPRAERVLLAILDILQSIPVLSFLPGVMLAMISLFPSRQVGVELGSILLIFTGQVWNMAFSFYSSLKAIPPELREAATVYRLQPVAALPRTRTALRRHRAGLEFHGFGGGRLVLPDGLRNVRAGQARFPAARTRLVPANRRQRRRYSGHDPRPRSHDCRHRADRPPALEAARRLVG